MRFYWVLWSSIECGWCFIENVCSLMILHVVLLSLDGLVLILHEFLLSLFGVLLSLYEALLSLYEVLLSSYGKILSLYVVLLSLYEVLLSLYGEVLSFMERFWVCMYEFVRSFIELWGFIEYYEVSLSVDDVLLRMYLV